MGGDLLEKKPTIVVVFFLHQTLMMIKTHATILGKKAYTMNTIISHEIFFSFFIFILTVFLMYISMLFQLHYLKFNVMYIFQV